MKNDNILKEFSDIWTDDAIAIHVQNNLKEYQAKTGKTLEFPIYPDEIAETLFDISFEYPRHVFDPLGIEVLASFDPNKKIIRINDSLKGSKGRVSFTIAHELAHASMHSFMIPIYCNTQVDKRSLRIIEKQADKYASILLMPKNLMITTIQSFVGRGLPIDLDLISPKLIPILQVSRQALEIRLGNLGYQLLNSRYGVSYERTHERIFLELEEERQTRKI